MVVNQERANDQVRQEPDSRLPVESRRIPTRHRLVTRLIALLLFLVIGSTSATGVWLINTSRQAMEQSSVTSNLQLADRTAAEVQQFVNNVVGILSLTGQMPGIAQMDPWQHSLILQNVIAGDQSGMFRALYTISTEGNEIANTTGVSSGLWTEKTWFQQARQGTLYISPPFVRDQEVLITIALPLQYYGEIIGILGADVSVQHLQEIAMQTQVGEEGIVFIVTHEGQWIAHPDWTVRSAADRVTDIQTLFATGQRISTYQDENGVEMWGGYSSVEVTGWKVVVQQPLSEVYAAAVQMTQQSLILIVLFVIVAISIGWVFMARTTRPLHDLVAGATAIGAGNLQYTIKVESQDEIGILARAFNRMTVQLRDLIGSLEQRVADRTADLARRSTHLEAAAQVARDAAAIRDLSQLLDQTVRLISERFGFYHAGIFLVDETGEYAVLQAASSAGGRRMLAREHKLKVGEVGIVGYVAGAGEPRIALDVGEDAVFFENPNLPDTRSEMALPLKSQEGVIGVLDVQSMEPEAFTEEDVAVLQTLADQITVAISNARLFRRVQESLETERRLSGELSAQAWRALLQARPGLEVRRNRKGLYLRREGKVAESMEEGGLALPIKVRGRTIGVLDARRPAGGAPWTEESQEWLEMFTEQLGAALESARLYEEARRRATRERLVGEVTARMRETLDVETVLKTAAREIGEALELAALDVRLSLAETLPSNEPQHKQEATGR